MICHIIIIWRLRNKSCHCQPEPAAWASTSLKRWHTNEWQINQWIRPKQILQWEHSQTRHQYQTTSAFKPSESQLLTWVMTRWVKYSVPVASQAESDSCVGIDTNQNDSYNYNKPSWFTKLTVSYYWTMQLTELNEWSVEFNCLSASQSFLLGQSSPVYILTTNVIRAWTAHRSVIQDP